MIGEKDLRTIDRRLRDGAVAQAREALDGFSLRGSSAQLVVSAAELAYRAGLPERGLQWLKPLVQSAGRRLSEDENLASCYAECVNRSGSPEEALRVLTPLSGSIARTHFARASALVSCWRYDEALPAFRKYLTSEKRWYQKLVARLNLVACLLFLGDRKRVPAVLAEVLAESSERKLWRIQSNALMLAAQLRVQSKRWNEALVCLDRAEKIATLASSSEGLFLAKWRAIVVLLRDDDPKPLKTVMEKAAQAKHWETIRDVGRYLALATGDTKKLLAVYFGTPFEAFRENLLRDCPKPLALPDSYERRLDPTTEPEMWIDLADRCLHAKRGRKSTSPVAMPKVLFQLLALVARDAYRPQKVITLFHGIYPGEFFDPDSSPTRVHQAMRRLRIWLGEQRCDLELVLDEDGYRLAGHKTAIRVPRSLVSDESEPLLERLRRRFGEETFRVNEAGAHLKASVRTLQRELVRLVDAGKIERAGKGRATVYRVLST